MIEVEPAVGELLPELRHGRDPQLERLAQPVERVAPGMVVVSSSSIEHTCIG